MDDSMLTSDDDSESVSFEVEKILDHRVDEGITYYKIRWKNYSSKDDTWEPEENIESESLIRTYFRLKGGRQNDTGAHAGRNTPNKRVLQVGGGKKRRIHVTTSRLQTGSNVRVRRPTPPRNHRNRYMVDDEASLIQACHDPPVPSLTPEKSLASLNGSKIAFIKMDAEGSRSSRSCFLHVLFQNRVLPWKYDLKTGTKLERTKEFQSHCWELIGQKVHKKASMREASELECKYVAITGPEVVGISLQNELEKLANFACLKPVKAVARLELLLTPATTNHIWKLHFNDFEFIEEQGNEGCGFVPENFFGSHVKADADALRGESLQVRIYGPRLGIGKGMLVKKRDIQKIQLPKSMLKVGPSLYCQDDWVYLVAKNFSPSNSNRNFGRFLDPTQPDPPETFMTQFKALGDMHVNFLVGLGVEKQVVETYKQRARKASGLRHTHLMGVVDPTGQLPANQVFITGYVSTEDGRRVRFGKKHDEVFVTRSPCLDPSDGKLLPIVRKKSVGMSEANWNFLKGLSFGHIIFATPENDKSLPMPVLIADGDLDGDLYFTLWEDNILKQLGTRIELRTLSPVKEQQGSIVKEDKKVAVSSPDWLLKAQDLMLQAESLRAGNNLIGKLFSLSQKIAKESKHGIFDRDARSLARAYKDAIDTVKHGGKVYLPRHLHTKLPNSMQHLLTTRPPVS